MTDPDETEAQRQRAADLRAAIDRLATGGAKPATPLDPRAADAPRATSPREFIERKMRDLDDAAKKDG